MSDDRKASAGSDKGPDRETAGSAGKARDQKSVRVRSYSGYKANERPLAFFLEDREIEVKEIADRWFGEENDYFRVLSEGGEEYLLRWHRSLDQWFLVDVRRGGTTGLCTPSCS